MIVENVETALKEFLQQKVQFVLNDKVIREGKLMLFNIKDFYISFIIFTKKRQNKTYELPVPFRVIPTNETLVFDYRLKNIHHNDFMQKLYITQIYSKVNKKSKLYDNVLVIRPQEDS
tara:strand:- start:123 stop:476 length:354 start_codon:yes stop_codon:yes gene_type:complete